MLIMHMMPSIEKLSGSGCVLGLKCLMMCIPASVANVSAQLWGPRGPTVPCVGAPCQRRRRGQGTSCRRWGRDRAGAGPVVLRWEAVCTPHITGGISYLHSHACGFLILIESRPACRMRVEPSLFSTFFYCTTWGGRCFPPSSLVFWRRTIYGNSLLVRIPLSSPLAGCL